MKEKKTYEIRDVPGTHKKKQHSRKKKISFKNDLPEAFLKSISKCNNMTPNALNMHIVHKTFVKKVQKHYQTVFSQFWATTTLACLVPAENTRHSEFPAHIPVK
jgi:hypothetical protein